MRSTTRLLIAAVAAVLILAPGSTATAADPQTKVPSTTIAWAPCPEDETAECGSLRVPIDWQRPRAGTVDIALARRRATDPSARIGSLVINPGGPGGSGVDFAIFGADYFSPEIQRHFDLVGFDPRGVARSHPVLCSLELLQQAPQPVLTSQADYDRAVAYNRRLYQDCRRHTGPLINHVDTLSVVRDIDAIRAAVGDRKLSFYGVSYGTLMGQQYAEQFPDRVRTLAIDSNMDHSLGTAGFLGTEAWTAQDSFNEFVKGCRSDPGCVLHDRNIRALWADLLRRAARGELHDPFDPTYVATQFDVIGLAFGSFYGPDWRGLAEFLVALDTGVPPGDTAFRLRAGAAAQQEEQLAEDAFQAVFCADWHLPIRDYQQYATHLAVQRSIAPDMRYSPLALSATEACLGWPGPVANPQHALRVGGGHQLLLINARHDPATGYVWALNAKRQLGKRAVLATYDGWGHGVYGRTECVTDVVDRYLVARVLPASGSHCAAAAAPAETLRQRQRGTVPVSAGPRPGVPGWQAR